MSVIEVAGARVHNLKNIDIQIPKNKLTVITGVSGSGKSSLAFDTIHAEGQRRFMETFAAYARQFIGNLERPDVDHISGLSPVIAIEQKTTNKSPRSTVGTITEIYDFLRLMFARAAIAYSYHTLKPMIRYSEEEIVNHIFEHFNEKKIMILAPVVKARKGHYRELFEQLRKQGYVRARIDGKIEEIKPKHQLDRYKVHDIEIVIDRLSINPQAKYRIAESVQTALKAGKDQLMILNADDIDTKPVLLSKMLMCAESGISYDEPSPNSFSFNSPYGYCTQCKGLGTVYQIDLDAVMPDKNKSIADGAIVPLGLLRDNFIFNQVKALAKKHKINIEQPIHKLPQSFMDMLLYGVSNVNVDLTFSEWEEEEEQNAQNTYSTTFEGIVNMVIRWFKNTESEHIKQWAEKFMHLLTCTQCNGSRLKKESLWFKMHDKNIAELCEMNINVLADWIKNLSPHLNKKQQTITQEIIKELNERLGFLLNVGLDYLQLNRSSRTLSGGESQRIRLATQIGSKLQGVTYILDEPSIGLHQRDNQKLISALKELRDVGNTILVVEHDKDIMLHADHLIEIGPGAGVQGGSVVAYGKPKDFLRSESPTAAFLSGKKNIAIPQERRKGNGKQIKLQGASGNNLQSVDVNFPLGMLICVTGVSGSGKSTLINETLYPILHKHIYNTQSQALPYKKVSGLQHIDKVIEIDQSPIGRTPRSNPATYCNFFTDIRQLYAEIPEAKIRGYKPGRFSFNVKGGRCEGCEGAGIKTIVMNFLPDVHVECDLCRGKRFNSETLEIRYKGKSISDILDMNVNDAVEFFVAIPSLYRKLKILKDVGLGYISLGQSAVTLSGGEAQRIKLSTELSKRDTGNTFYILDEPTTGLHFQDIDMLIHVLQTLVNKGNTVLVIEHNMDIIKVADYIIDIGPEGGHRGGNIVAYGTPEQIIKQKESITGRFLKLELK